MTATALTVESAAALGTVDGREFAKRTLAAMMAVGGGTPEAEQARDAVIDDWSAKQAADHDARRLDLACRGADLAVLEAYTDARAAGYRQEMESFAATMNGLAAELDREGAATVKLNRAEKRKAAALARKAKAQ